CDFAPSSTELTATAYHSGFGPFARSSTRHLRQTCCRSRRLACCPCPLTSQEPAPSGQHRTWAPAQSSGVPSARPSLMAPFSRLAHFAAAPGRAQASLWSSAPNQHRRLTAMRLLRPITIWLSSLMPPLDAPNSRLIEPSSEQNARGIAQFRTL